MTKIRPLLFACLATLVSATAAHPTQAQEDHDSGMDILVRLASTLGEAHYIRTLCNGDEDQYWRRYMVEFLDIEATSPDRRAALVGAFNRGYRTQSGQRSGCTPDLSVVEAEIAARGRSLADQAARRHLQ